LKQIFSTKTVEKNGIFPSTKFAHGIWAFNIYNTTNPLKSKQLALIIAPFWTSMEPLFLVSRGKTGRLIPGRGMIGTAEGCYVAKIPMLLLPYASSPVKVANILIYKHM
jgi:hypothetical protein